MTPPADHRPANRPSSSDAAGVGGADTDGATAPGNGDATRTEVVPQPPTDRTAVVSPGDWPAFSGPPAASAPDLTGQTVGKYVFGEVLGRGAMGVVYRATDTSLDRTVAVKVPVLGDRRDSELVERLVREAKAAAGLSHPHIGGVYEIFTVGSGPAVAMEFIEGRKLGEMIQDGGPLPASRAATIAAEIAEALAVAHAAGLIHRDVKPANVMIRRDGRAVLLDFGLVWATESAAQSRLTHEGLSVGSPAYMSPEQIAGQELTARSDIYNLGVTLFEMLTGEVPFKGTVSAVVAQALHNEPPAVTDLRPDVPRRIADCCHRAMRKKASGRFDSAADFERHLLAAAAGKDALTSDRISSLIGTSPRSRRTGVAAVVAALFAVVGVLAVPLIPWADDGQESSTQRPLTEAGRAPQTDASDLSRAVPSLPAEPSSPVMNGRGRPRLGPVDLDGLRRRVANARPDEPFATFDTDRDGMLSPHELLLHVIRRADADGDGRLTSREYRSKRDEMGRAFFDPPEWGSSDDPLDILLELGPPE